MFVLGIPGGISAAVILGALMIHGLQPGIRLFSHSPQVIYTVMWGFLLANLVMGFVAVFLARTMAYLTLFPRGLIGPLILIFSIIGVYAGSNNYYDIWIMCGFGVLGYLMNKHGYSTAGVLLGIILGPICENGLRDMLVVSDGAPIAFMLTRPISVVLLVCIAMAVYFSFKPKAWEMREGERVKAKSAGGAEP